VDGMWAEVCVSLVRCAAGMVVTVAGPAAGHETGTGTATGRGSETGRQLLHKLLARAGLM
jgi:hypothetical protein